MKDRLQLIYIYIYYIELATNDIDTLTTTHLNLIRKNILSGRSLLLLIICYFINLLKQF